MGDDFAGFEHGTHGGPTYGTSYQIHPSTSTDSPDGLKIQRSERQSDEMAYGSWWHLKVDRNTKTAEFTLNEDQRSTYGPLTIKFYVDGRGNPVVDVDMPWQTARNPRGTPRE